MKIFTAFLILALASGTSFAGGLFPAIVAVESGGNPAAVGDKGQAHGLIQAHRAAWTEGCQALGVHWSYERGVRNAWRCRTVFYAYTSRYGARTDEQRARCWNSGPGWRHKVKATNGYWRRVRAAMAG
jgi:hypothetical protein